MATPGAPFPANRLDAITMQSESNGRRYGAGGGLLRSPKGAMGEMQVMPGTARDPGYGVRPWQGGADDLARVGRDYRAAMEREFGGDYAAMFGAYNAGPGRIKNLIERHGSDWLRYAPKETQDYVRKNLRALGGR